MKNKHNVMLWTNQSKFDKACNMKVAPVKTRPNQMAEHYQKRAFPVQTNMMSTYLFEYGTQTSLIMKF